MLSLLKKNLNKKWLPRVILLFLLAFSLCIRTWGITEIKELVFDEVYFAKFSQDLMTFKECPEYSKEKGGYEEDRGCYDVHPPLGKLIIAAGESFFDFSDFNDYEAQKKNFEERKKIDNNVGSFHYEFTDQNVLGWRIMPIIFGLILITLMYVTASLLFKNEWLGLLAAFLMAIDNYFLAQTRLALMDVFLITFQISSLLMFLLYLKDKKSYLAYFYLLLTGVFAGLALGVKFTGIAVVGIFAIYFFLEELKKLCLLKRVDKLFFAEIANKILIYVGIIPLLGVLFSLDKIFAWMFSDGKMDFSLLKQIFGAWVFMPVSGFYTVFLWSALALIVIFHLFLIYKKALNEKNKILGVFKWITASLLNIFGILGITAFVFWGVVMLPEFIMGHPFPWETDIQGKFSYHLHLTDGHPYASSWQLWPFSYKPVFYYYRVLPFYSEILDVTNWKIVAINAHGNLLLWWFSSFSILFILFAYLANFLNKNNDDKSENWADSYLLILAGFAVSWLPWMFITRISFLYHFLPSVPFMFLAATATLATIYKIKKIGTKLVTMLLILFLICFFFYLPVSIGLPVSESLYHLMMFT